MRHLAIAGCALLTPIVLIQTLRGGDDLCPSTIGPDVIVADLPKIRFWGTVNGISGYSIATTSCNIGDEVLPWYDMSNEHPVIAQHMYKLTDQRIEQIGMSWVKHGWGAAQDPFCCEQCIPSGSFFLLGIGCSDPYCVTLNGDQDGFNGVAGLGPRSEINAATGEFSWPYGSMGQSGNDVYKRIQVPVVDIDPALNSNARYFIEAHYVSPDDALAQNHHNNASHREAIVTKDVGIGWWMDILGQMYVMEPAIFAWANNDPGVQIDAIDVPADGRLHVASKATDNGDGTWHYEYAVHNLGSDRSVRGLKVPFPAAATMTNPDFHDVNHHSGEPYDGTDWVAVLNGGTVIWQTQSHNANPHGNAIRWGTMYNFAFDSNLPPGPVAAEVVLFKPGTPASVFADVVGPIVETGPCSADLTGDTIVDTTDLLQMLAAWGACPGCPEDLDGDGTVAVADVLALLAAWGPCN